MEPIISTIKDPRTKGNRGTLLYALEPFDVSEHVESLVELISGDTFEVSLQSLQLLKSVVDKLSKEAVLKCRNRLEEKLEQLEQDTEFVSQALVLFQ